jgi:hypothetical protein
MISESVVIILSVLMTVAVVFGAVNLISIKSFGRQKEEIERILQWRVFTSEEKTAFELKKFFDRVRRAIFLSTLGFTSAFVLFIFVAKSLWPTDSIPKTIISLVILLVVFGGPLIMLVMADKNLILLKRDIMSRFYAK